MPGTCISFSKTKVIASQGCCDNVTAMQVLCDSSRCHRHEVDIACHFLYSFTSSLLCFSKGSQHTVEMTRGLCCCEGFREAEKNQPWIMLPSRGHQPSESVIFNMCSQYHLGTCEKCKSDRFPPPSAQTC